jgi:hypothetical protein
MVAERRYVVREEHVSFIEYEVIATSKKAAVEKAKDGDVVSSYPNPDASPTGRWEVERA